MKELERIFVVVIRKKNTAADVNADGRKRKRERESE